MSSDETRDPFELHDPQFAAGFDALYTQTWGAGAIPPKYKELTGVSLSIVSRCEPCLAYHLKMAHGHSATQAELVEAIRIGVLSGGSVTIPTARAGYRVLQELGTL